MIRPETLERKRLESGYYNMTCPICGKRFHRKQCRLKTGSQRYGFTCSLDCSREVRKIAMTGENNHQYGLKGDKNASFIDGDINGKNNTVNDRLVYVGYWYAKKHLNGRVKKHRYIVEKNHECFDNKNFEKIGDWYYLKEGLDVHHIDLNHDNNDLSNLQILTKSEHVTLHNKLRKSKKS